MGQEPISCFCSARRLDVQVHPMDMMLVCLQSNSWCWVPSREASGTIFIVSGKTQLGIEPQPTNRSVDDKATELVTQST